MTNSDYTILVVDDDELNRDMLSRRLERKEYKVLVACDGPEALEIAGRELLDMVILDIMMQNCHTPTKPVNRVGVTSPNHRFTQLLRNLPCQVVLRVYGCSIPYFNRIY